MLNDWPTQIFPWGLKILDHKLCEWCTRQKTTNRLLTFCRAIEETSDAGLMLFDRQDLRATIQQLEAVKKDVERVLLGLSLLTTTRCIRS